MRLGKRKFKVLEDVDYFEGRYHRTWSPKTVFSLEKDGFVEYRDEWVLITEKGKEELKHWAAHI